MIFETVITSVPRGLKAGRTGSQPVMRTRGLRDDLLNQLGPLAGYRHVHRQGSGQNPVIFSYRRLSSNIGDLAVIGRTVDAGSDFSNRSNKCGHLVAFTADELGRLSRTTPAAILAGNASLFAAQWTKGPEERSTPPAIVEPPQEPAVCTLWQQQFGDAGWAGLVAERARRRQPTMLVAPDCTPQSSELLLGLIREATALLSPGERWAVSFETTVLASSDSLIQGTYRGSPEAEAPRPGMLVLPLGGPLPQTPLEETALCKLARFGKPRPATPAPPPVTTAASPAPTGDNFLGDDLPSPSPGSPPPLVPKKTGWQGGSLEPLPEDNRVPWGTIIGASVSFLFILFLAGWYAWTTVSANLAEARNNARQEIFEYADHAFIATAEGADKPPPEPTAETWKIARFDFLKGELSRPAIQRANFLLRLPKINRHFLSSLIRTDGNGQDNSKLLLSLFHKPFKDFAEDDYVALGILANPTKIQNPELLLSFLNEAAESNDLDLLKLADKLAETLKALSKLELRPDKTPSQEDVEKLSKLFTSCPWRYQNEVIWPTGKKEARWVSGYLRSAIKDRSNLENTGVAGFSTIRTQQVAAIRKLDGYRTNNTEKPPTLADYQAAFGERLKDGQLNSINNYLATLQNDAPTPDLADLLKIIKKPANARPQPPTPQRNSADIFKQVRDKFKPTADNANATSYTLVTGVADLDKIAGLMPVAMKLKNGKNLPGLVFKEKDPGLAVWTAFFQDQECGELSINAAEKRITFSVKEDAHPMVKYWPICLASPKAITKAETLNRANEKSVALKRGITLWEMIESDGTRPLEISLRRDSADEFEKILPFLTLPFLTWESTDSENVSRELLTGEPPSLNLEVTTAEAGKVFKLSKRFDVELTGHKISLKPAEKTVPYFAKPAANQKTKAEDFKALAWTIAEALQFVEKKQQLEDVLITAVRFQDGDEKDCLSPANAEWHNDKEIQMQVRFVFQAGVPNDPSQKGASLERDVLGADGANDRSSRSWEAMLFRRLAVKSKMYNDLQTDLTELEDLEAKKTSLKAQSADSTKKKEVTALNEQIHKIAKKKIATLKAAKNPRVEDYKDKPFDYYMNEFVKGDGFLYNECVNKAQQHDGKLTGKPDKILEESVVLSAILLCHLRTVAAKQLLFEKDEYATTKNLSAAELLKGSGYAEFEPLASDEGDRPEGKTIEPIRVRLFNFSPDPADR